MKLTYIANARFPTEKAHGIQIAKMCEAFADNGLKVTLILPKRIQINPSLRNQDPFAYYQVKSNFKTKTILNVDFLPLHQLGINTGDLAYLIQEISFALAATLVSLQDSLVITRSKTVAFLRNLLKKPVIYEAHDRGRESWLDKSVASNSQFVVSISTTIKESWEVLGAKTLYAPDGVSKEFFKKRSKQASRTKLALPHNQKIILYTGNLYPRKGIDTLIKTAEILNNYHFYIVGGSIIDKNITPLKRKALKHSNVHVIGFQPYQLIPTWLSAADILVLPNSAKSIKSKEDTSPLKLFEYLASGKPIVASKVLSITQIVNKNEVYFFQPDNETDLASKITLSVTGKKEANNKTNKAKLKAKSYKWSFRAKKIIDAIIILDKLDK